GLATPPSRRAPTPPRGTSWIAVRPGCGVSFHSCCLPKRPPRVFSRAIVAICAANKGRIRGVREIATMRSTIFTECLLQHCRNRASLTIRLIEGELRRKEHEQH